MKRLITQKDYKNWLERRRKKSFRRNLIKFRKRSCFTKKHGNNSELVKRNSDQNLVIYAPTDLRLIENTEECLQFFSNLRDVNNQWFHNGKRYVEMSLKFIEQIDYASISILTYVSEELLQSRVYLNGNLPDFIPCRKFMIDSGYLDRLFDQNGKPFPKSPKSKLIFFEKGSGRLTDQHIDSIHQIVDGAVTHLTQNNPPSGHLITMIKEICANSIEWSRPKDQLWLLGVHYMNDKVEFTVTDFGRGILDTLHRKNIKQFEDTIRMRSRDEVLMRAFEQEYSSSSQEINRNKGLPAIKFYQDGKMIKNLIILTNNVILHFDNHQDTRTFDKKTRWFKGTFYKWEIDLNNLNQDNLQYYGI